MDEEKPELKSTDTPGESENKAEVPCTGGQREELHENLIEEKETEPISENE